MEGSGDLVCVLLRVSYSVSLVAAAAALDGGDSVAKIKNYRSVTCLSEAQCSFPPVYSVFRRIWAAAFAHWGWTWVQSHGSVDVVERLIYTVITDSVACFGWRRTAVPEDPILTFTHCLHRALLGRTRQLAAIEVSASLLCQKEEGVGLITGCESPVGNAFFQIFIKAPAANSFSIWIRNTDSILYLKGIIQSTAGFPSHLQSLIYGEKALADTRTPIDYAIASGSTVCLNLRLRGGKIGPTRSHGTTPGASASNAAHSNGPSYRNVLQGGKNKAATETAAQADNSPKPYIVEQQNCIPEINIDIPDIELHRTVFESQAIICIICRFNCFWPKPVELFHWIFTNWTMDCEIHLCSKGFFIVKFSSSEDRDTILKEGPWFWGSTGLFITPWFPDFDANTMEVTRMPVWVRLHNLPLHFWQENVLGGIGNILGRYIKTDIQRMEERIYTFARICVEVDLSKGLPECIILNHKQQRWTQHLDYENTAFRCRICRNTGHLQNTCPAAPRDNRRKKKTGKVAKGWQYPSEEPEQ